MNSAASRHEQLGDVDGVVVVQGGLHAVRAAGSEQGRRADGQVAAAGGGGGPGREVAALEAAGEDLQEFEKLFGRQASLSKD